MVYTAQSPELWPDVKTEWSKNKLHRGLDTDVAVCNTAGGVYVYVLSNAS
jgi:hypothetical protein